MKNRKQDRPLPSMEQAKALAGNPEVQELMALLRRQGGDDLQQALNKAAQGDMDSAKQMLSTLLASPDAQKLLQQFGR